MAVSKVGVDLSPHRSRPLDLEGLEGADLIVAMTSVHVTEILSIAPQVESKVVLLKQLVETDVESRPEGGSAQDRLKALLAARRPPQRRAHDLDDPIGLPYSAYERCLQELRGGVEKLVEALCG